MFVFIILVSVSLIDTSVYGQSEPLVDTPLGKIRGSSMSSSSGRSFLAFRGIPFAKPPIADLRFKDPVPAEPWNEVLDGTKEGPTCIQFDLIQRTIKGTEDCLALNVYTHSLSDDVRPVMVWIHGGAWYMGSGNGEREIYGPELIMTKDVVLVTINYRFLTTESEDAPGNYGLLDQTLALQWVQKYIRHFGGDPNAVTIFGESAGGGSVHFHVLSPHSKGLFHRAIAQSGTSLCPWALPDAVGKYSLLLASSLGCQSQSVSERLTCIKSKDAEQLAAIFAETVKSDIVFGPRIDNERSRPFLPAHPKELLAKGEFNHVPMIAGFNQNEAAMTIATLLAENGKQMEELVKDPVEKLIELLMMKDKAKGRELTRLAINYYLNPDKSFDQQLSELEKLLSDYVFSKPVDETVHLHVKHSSESTYYYMYAHRGQLSLTAMFGAPPDLDLGVCHGDELFLMFKGGVLPGPMTEGDIEVSKILIDLWTSFAVKGVPKSDAVSNWTPATAEQTSYLNINTEPLVVSDKMPFHDRLAFWSQLENLLTVKDEL